MNVYEMGLVAVMVVGVGGSPGTEGPGSAQESGFPLSVGLE